jgi:hypothetical protein
MADKKKSFVLFRRKEDAKKKMNEYEFTAIWCAEIHQENDDYDNEASYQLCCQGTGRFVPWQYFVSRHDCVLMKHPKGGLTIKKQGATVHPHVRKHEQSTGQSSWFIPPDKFRDLQKGKTRDKWSWSKTWLDFKSPDSPFLIILEGATFQSNHMLSLKDLKKLREDSFCLSILQPENPIDEGMAQEESEPDARVNIDVSDEEGDDQGSEGGIVSDDEEFGRYCLADCTVHELRVFMNATSEYDQQDPLLCLTDAV